MTVQINDKFISIPNSIKEFTLGQRAEFHRQHGESLITLAKQISEMPEGEDKEVFQQHHYFESMFRSFSFFSGVDVDVLKKSDFIDEIAVIYHTKIQALFEEDRDELQQSFQWQGEEWVLHTPELFHGSKMKFGEFIDAKQVVKDIVSNGGSRWDYTIPIAAIYLRKKDEVYKESFLHDGSERLKMMESLPMSIALQVGFFLTSTMSSSTSTLQFSISPGLRVVEDLSKRTTTNMAG